MAKFKIWLFVLFGHSYVRTRSALIACTDAILKIKPNVQNRIPRESDKTFYILRVGMIHRIISNKNHINKNTPIFNSGNQPSHKIEFDWHFGFVDFEFWIFLRIYTPTYTICLDNYHPEFQIPLPSQYHVPHSIWFIDRVTVLTTFIPVRVEKRR